MKSLYIAAEKLVKWNDHGQLAVERATTTALCSHRTTTQFVVCFAPARFGLYFDDRRDVEEAWKVMADVLNEAGFVAHRVVMFDEDIDWGVLRRARLVEDPAPVFLTDSDDDRAMARGLGMKCISDVPVQFARRRVDVPYAVKTLFHAAVRA